MTTDLNIGVIVRATTATTTTITTTTAALEARNLKTAYQVHIVDYYYCLDCCCVTD